MTDDPSSNQLRWWVTPVLSGAPVILFGAIFGLLIGGGLLDALRYGAFAGGTWIVLAVATAWIKASRESG